MHRLIAVVGQTRTTNKIKWYFNKHMRGVCHSDTAASILLYLYSVRTVDNNVN